MACKVGPDYHFCKVSRPDLALYHASPSCSQNVLWMLEEIGEPYDVKLLNLEKSDQLKPDYLAINPMRVRRRSERWGRTRC